MSEGHGELVATDEPAVIPKPLLNAIVVEDGQSDGCLANPAGINEGERSEVFCQTNDLLDQLVTSKEGPRWRWRRFSSCTRYKYEVPDPVLVEIADQFWA